MQTNIRTIRLVVLPIIFAMAAAVPAEAQTSGSTASEPTEGKSSPASAAAGEIVVTALRRSEAASKVPAALTAVSGDSLKAMGIVNVQDLKYAAPALEISKGALGINVSIRGISTNDTSSKGEQDVSFNVDGVYMGRGAEQQTAFFDINRVEVLRGPQGTLYGHSATAGAINVITNAPRLDSFGGYLNGTIGNYGTRRVEGAVNLPITSTLALRVAGAANYRDGYSKPYDQTIVTSKGSYFISAKGQAAKNDENNQTGRASLLFEPDPSLTARATLTIGKLGGAGFTGTDYDNLMAAHENASGLAVPVNPVPSWVDEHFTLINGQISKVAGPVQIVFEASHQTFNMNDQITSSQNPAVNHFAFKLDQQLEHFNTNELELRFSNAGTSRIDYTAGANYYREKINENYHEWEAPVATWFNQSTWAPQIEPNNVTTHEAWGIYGQSTWHATDKLGIVGGVRYTHDQVVRVGTFGFGNYAGPCNYPDSCTGGNVSPNNGHEADHKLTWRAGLNYQLDRANLVYASVSTGFKGGGFNDVSAVTGIAGGAQAYAPEELTAYEVGYKGRPFSNLTIASSLYYNDFSVQQIAGFLYFMGQYITGTSTAPTRIYGWENEIKWQADRKTALSGSFTLMHSKYVNYIAGQNYGTTVQWAGIPLSLVPKFTVSEALDRDIGLADGSHLHLRLASRYNSGYYLNDAGAAVRFHQPSFTRSDASISFTPRSKAFTFQIYALNLENKIQLTGGPDIYFGPVGTAASNYAPGAATYPNGSTFSVSDPRTYGARLSVTF